MPNNNGSLAALVVLGHSSSSDASSWNAAQKEWKMKDPVVVVNKLSEDGGGRLRLIGVQAVWLEARKI
jgi:hypothetical protein